MPRAIDVVNEGKYRTHRTSDGEEQQRIGTQSIASGLARLSNVRQQRVARIKGSFGGNLDFLHVPYAANLTVSLERKRAIHARTSIARDEV